MIVYVVDDFKEAVPGRYFCPGCNASADDAALPSVGCPCGLYGTGKGSLTTEGVEAYLRNVWLS